PSTVPAPIPSAEIDESQYSGESNDRSPSAPALILTLTNYPLLGDVVRYFGQIMIDLAVSEHGIAIRRLPSLVRSIKANGFGSGSAIIANGKKDASLLRRERSER